MVVKQSNLPLGLTVAKITSNFPLVSIVVKKDKMASKLPLVSILVKKIKW